MTVDVLLPRLPGVRQVAAGRWRAPCVACGGGNPSALSIGETSDGTVLVKCFKGCSAAEVVAAVGLELHDLFPRADWQQTGKHYARPRRPRVDWPAMVAVCERDLLLVKIVLAMIGGGERLADADATACNAAATRVFLLVQEARCG